MQEIARIAVENNKELEINLRHRVPNKEFIEILFKKMCGRIVSCCDHSVYF